MHCRQGYVCATGLMGVPGLRTPSKAFPSCRGGPRARAATGIKAKGRSQEAEKAVDALMHAIAASDRGLNSSAVSQIEIQGLVKQLETIGRGQLTTGQSLRYHGLEPHSRILHPPCPMISHRALQTKACLDPTIFPACPEMAALPCPFRFSPLICETTDALLRPSRFVWHGTPLTLAPHGSLSGPQRRWEAPRISQRRMREPHAIFIRRLSSSWRKPGYLEPPQETSSR